MEDKNEVVVEEKSLFEKTKLWCKKHKKGIIIVGCTIVGFKIFKKGIEIGQAKWITDQAIRTNEHIKYLDNSKLLGELAVSREVIHAVDEDIFTDLAISIEDSVLSKGVEHEVIEKAYDLGNVVKKVVVNIDNV